MAPPSNTSLADLRGMVDAARRAFWAAAEPLIVDKGPEAREFAEALARAIGEISLADALTALTQWLEDHRDAATNG